MAPRPPNSRLSAAVAAALFAVVGVVYWSWHSGGSNSGLGATTANADAPNPPAHSDDSVDLSDTQLDAVKVEPVEAIGFDGDSIEAQCFAYCALRSRRGWPISFPTTTGAPKPMTGGAFWPAPK